MNTRKPMRSHCGWPVVFFKVSEWCARSSTPRSHSVPAFSSLTIRPITWVWNSRLAARSRTVSTRWLARVMLNGGLKLVFGILGSDIVSSLDLYAGLAHDRAPLAKLAVDHFAVLFRRHH